MTNVPSPYRVDFFNELGKKCDLTVLFERTDATDRNNEWFEKKSRYYNEILLKGIEVRSDSSLSFEVIKHLNKNLYDIIVVGVYSSPTAMLAINYLKLKQIPFVLNADGGFIKENESLIKQKIKHYYISSAKYWLSSGDWTNKYLEYYGAKSEHIFIYPFTSLYKEEILNYPIIDIEKEQLKKELGITAKKVVISVGRFIHGKGMDILIDAWTQMDVQEDWELIIIGGGELKDKYYELINKRKLRNVKILDFFKKKELMQYYKAADVMMLMTREDIWGLVINEALACGLPVITTDKCIAGLELIKNGENGFIVSLDNLENATHNLSLLLSNKQQLNEQFSYKAIKSISNYSIENMARVHVEIFDKIMRM